MAVDDPDTVDIMSIDPSGAIILRIADHLEWSDSISHQQTLQAKMNRYLAFIESGEILEHHPDAAQRRVVIEVVSRYEPDAHGLAFIRRAQVVIEKAGVQPSNRAAHFLVTPHTTPLRDDHQSDGRLSCVSLASQDMLATRARCGHGLKSRFQKLPSPFDRFSGAGPPILVR